MKFKDNKQLDEGLVSPFQEIKQRIATTLIKNEEFTESPIFYLFTCLQRILKNRIYLIPSGFCVELINGNHLKVESFIYKENV